MLGLIAYTLCGLGAMITSILAWRLKSQVNFLIGMILTGIVIVVNLFHMDVFISMIESENFFLLLVSASLFVIPSIFLILSKTNPSGANGSTNIDGITAAGPVTEKYLDDIISEPDEDINFDEDYDLK